MMFAQKTAATTITFKTMMKKELINGLYDLHSHLLCGLDDGAQDIKESIAMLKTAQAEGISVMAVTPHLVLDGTQDILQYHMQKRLEELRYEQLENRINIQLIAGFELFLDETIYTCKTLEQFTFSNSSLLLFEIAENCPKELLFDAILWLLDKNFTPVMAHPERYSQLGTIMHQLKLLGDKGLWLQINTSSISGNCGVITMSRAKSLAQSGLKFVLGTDAHSLHTRPPHMQKSINKLQSWIGTEKTLIAAKSAPRILLEI